MTTSTILILTQRLNVKLIATYCDAICDLRYAICDTTRCASEMLQCAPVRKPRFVFPGSLWLCAAVYYVVVVAVASLNSKASPFFPSIRFPAVTTPITTVAAYGPIRTPDGFRRKKKSWPPYLIRSSKSHHRHHRCRGRVDQGWVTN